MTVVGYGTDEFPAFYSGSSDLSLPVREPRGAISAVLQAGDPLIAIDAETGRRSIFYVPASGPITMFATMAPYSVVRSATDKPAPSASGSEIF